MERSSFCKTILAVRPRWKTLNKPGPDQRRASSGLICLQSRVRNAANTQISSLAAGNEAPGATVSAVHEK